MTSASGFIAALQAAGLAMHREADLVPDGSLHRYRVDGDKAGSLNGWYVLDLTEPVHAAFGSWKTGQSCTWRPDQAAPMTDAEREALARRREAARAARDSEQAAVRAAARLRAEKLWSRAKPATNEHAYLVGKSVGAFGIRDLRGQLVIPLRDGKGALHTLQFIGADGRKTFLTGGASKAVTSPSAPPAAYSASARDTPPGRRSTSAPGTRQRSPLTPATLRRWLWHCVPSFPIWSCAFALTTTQTPPATLA